jgi:hypothetical protein
MFGLVRRRTPADRGTIIALRATHTAHRVASHVAYPELREPLVRVAQPLDVYDAERLAMPYEATRFHRRADEFTLAHLLLFVGILLAIIFLVIFLANG